MRAQGDQWMILTWLLFIAATTVMGSSRVAAASNLTYTLMADQGFPDDGLVRIKLIPFKAQIRRRRQERKLRRLHGEENLEEEEREFDKLLAAHKNRPDHYSRRQVEQQVAELFQGYGTHYADLWVGTPHPQRQTVIVDTGSGVTAFPCAGCEKCGVPEYHADLLFDQDQSISFHKLTCDECLRGHCYVDECRITMSYQEGSSWSAFESVDTCYLGGLHSSAVAFDPTVEIDGLNPFLAIKFAFPLKFGCQNSLTGLFITQLADGIMGLDNAASSFVQQMRDSGVIQSNTFSLCYSRHDSVDTDGTESGAFTVGGTDERLHNTPMVYTAPGGGGGFYDVSVRNIYLRTGDAGTSAQSTDPNVRIDSLGLSLDVLQRGNVIVDSGTTDTYFSRAVGSKFGSLFKHLSGVNNDNKKKSMTLDEVKALPTILIQLEGDHERNQQIRDGYGKPVPGLAEEVDPSRPTDVLLAIPPTHYMEYDDEEEAWTNRFYTTEPSGGVIGGNAMMGHDVFFDAEKRQVGWSEADCDYTALMAKYDFKPALAPSREENSENTVPEEISDPETSPNTEQPEPEIPEPDAGADDALNVATTTEEQSGFCSTLSCRGAFLSAVLLATALIALRLIQRKRRSAYALSIDADVAQELELQDAAGNVGSDGVIHYRDEPPEVTATRINLV